MSRKFSYVADRCTTLCKTEYACLGCARNWTTGDDQSREAVGGPMAAAVSFSASAWLARAPATCVWTRSSERTAGRPPAAAGRVGDARRGSDGRNEREKKKKIDAYGGRPAHEKKKKEVAQPTTPVTRKGEDGNPKIDTRAPPQPGAATTRGGTPAAAAANASPRTARGSPQAREGATAQRHLAGSPALPVHGYGHASGPTATGHHTTHLTERSATPQTRQAGTQPGITSVSLSVGDKAGFPRRTPRGLERHLGLHRPWCLLAPPLLHSFLPLSGHTTAV